MASRVPYHRLRHLMTAWPGDVAASAGGLSGSRIAAPAAAAVRESLQWRLPVLFSDKWESFVIIDKACGVPCVEAHYTDDSVRIRLGESHPWRPRVWFPHRLDKHARGLMAVAFSSYSCGQLAASLSAGLWKKRYRVLAAIPPRELRRVYRNPFVSSGDGSPLFQHGTGDMVNTGTIVSYLGERDVERFPHPTVRASTLRRAVAADESATSPKLSVTHFHLLDMDEDRGLGLYDIVLGTGRTHQIRVHFAESGAPLVNDWYYNPACVRWAPGSEFPGDLCLQAYSLDAPLPLERPQFGTLARAKRVRTSQRRYRWDARQPQQERDPMESPFTGRCQPQPTVAAPSVTKYEDDEGRARVAVELPCPPDFRAEWYPQQWWRDTMGASASAGETGSATTSWNSMLP